MVAFFCFGGLGVVDGLQQSPIVEPVHPFEHSVFDSFKGSPGSSPMYHLCLVKAVDRLGQGVVIAVANTSDRGFYPCFGEAFGVLDREILGEFKRSSQHLLCSSKVGNPEHVRRWRMELPVDVIQRTRRRLIADRGTRRHAPDHAPQVQTRGHFPPATPTRRNCDTSS